MGDTALVYRYFVDVSGTEASVIPNPAEGLTSVSAAASPPS